MLCQALIFPAILILQGTEYTKREISVQVVNIPAAITPSDLFKVIP